MRKTVLTLILVLAIGFVGYQIGTMESKSLQKPVVLQEAPSGSTDYAVIPASAEYTPPADVVSLNKTFIEVAEKVNPSVVTITTEKVVKMKDPWHEFFGDDWFSPFFQMPEREMHSTVLGSGVIVSEDGYILTNNHVVERGDEIKVSLMDKREYTAEIVGTDPKTDVAVIKIDAENLTPAVLGNSDILRVGEWVLAIGSPFSPNLDHTVTAGIISALGRSRVISSDNYEDFIQTDAAINPGNSGGALVNIKGELIGINTAIATGGRTAANAGIGFAIPINLAKRIMKELIEKGKVTRAWLGVVIQDINASIAEAMNLDEITGALVSEVVEDSPADKAGVKVQDVIIEFDGKKVTDSSHLRNMVSNSEPDSRKSLVVIRDGKVKKLKVKLGVLPENLAQSSPTRPEMNDLGLNVSELTPDMARRFGYPRNQEGVIVVDVERGSAAAQAAIAVGDVILKIDDEPIYNLSDYRMAMKNLEPGSKALLLLKRRTHNLFVVLKVPK